MQRSHLYSANSGILSLLVSFLHAALNDQFGRHLLKKSEKNYMKQTGHRKRSSASSPFFILCYTRPHAFCSEETLPCRCHGAHLSRVLCADEPHERALGHSHESAVSFCKHSAADYQGLSARLPGHRLRHQGSDVSRQAFREIQSATPAHAG